MAARHWEREGPGDVMAKESSCAPITSTGEKERQETKGGETASRTNKSTIDHPKVNLELKRIRFEGANCK